jgi:hypothetical protein
MGVCVGAIDSLKTVAGLVQQINDIPLQRSIIDLQSEVYGLIEQNRDLQDKNRSLTEALASRERLVTEGDGKYYCVDDDGTRKGPICPHCYLESGLVLPIEFHIGFRALYCHTCGKRFIANGPG